MPGTLTDTTCHILRLPLELRLKIAVLAVGAGPRPEDASSYLVLGGFVDDVVKKRRVEAAILRVAGFDMLKSIYPTAFESTPPMIFLWQIRGIPLNEIRTGDLFMQPFHAGYPGGRLMIPTRIRGHRMSMWQCLPSAGSAQCLFPDATELTLVFDEDLSALNAALTVLTQRARPNLRRLCVYSVVGDFLVCDRWETAFSDGVCSTLSVWAFEFETSCLPILKDVTALEALELRMNAAEGTRRSTRGAKEQTNGRPDRLPGILELAAALRSDSQIGSIVTASLAAITCDGALTSRYFVPNA